MFNAVRGKHLFWSCDHAFARHDVTMTKYPHTHQRFSTLIINIKIQTPLPSSNQQKKKTVFNFHENYTVHRKKKTHGNNFLCVVWQHWSASRLVSFVNHPWVPFYVPPLLRACMYVPTRVVHLFARTNQQLASPRSLVPNALKYEASETS